MELASNKLKSHSQTSIDVAIIELLASRICHDLISPVGAVHNGVEFLEEMGEAHGDAINLIAHSAQQASARLQVFRFAYGAGGRDPNIKFEDVYNTFNELLEGDNKIKLDWDPHSSIGFDTLPFGICKILMGGLILAQECLPKGGTIKLEPGEETNSILIVSSGEGANLRANVDQALKQNINVEDLDPRLVHPYVLSVLAESYGFVFDIYEQTSSEITFILKLNE
jgi:histidine phosphotransferase ChpT